MVKRAVDEDQYIVIKIQHYAEYVTVKFFRSGLRNLAISLE